VDRDLVEAAAKGDRAAYVEQLDPGCRNSLDDAGFLLRINP
jgi:hypothetical protein